MAPQHLCRSLAVAAALAIGGCSSSPAGTSAVIPGGGGDVVAADAGPRDLPPPAPDCATSRLEATAGGVLVTNDCGAEVVLAPRALVDGVWGGEACGLREGDAAVACAVGEAGQVVAIVASGGAILMRFEAARDVTVEGFELAGQAHLPGATGWLSNGFQSWSQSGVIALGPRQDEAAVMTAVAVEGDEEVIRPGATHSWWRTFVGGGDAALFAGAMSALRFRSWAQCWDAGAGKVGVRLVSGAVPADRKAVKAGESLAGETWQVALGDDLEALLTAHGEGLLTRRTRAPVAAQAGWNSWYELWSGVDAAAVTANAALADAVLRPALPVDAAPLAVTIDDGWQLAWGDWQPNAKFPDGVAGVATALAADGFEVGLWMAPLLVHQDSVVALEHPDWLVEGATYPHALEGTMGVLDPTVPEAREHLKGFIAAAVGWGVTILKIDFLFAGTFAGTRAQDVTGLEAYHLALQAIREAAGEDVVLLAVGAPALPSLPWVDAWRVGGDIVIEPLGPSFPFVANQARSVAARWPVCLATLCDADPVLLRELPRSEVELSAWTVAMAGGGYMLSDDLRLLPSERPAWGVDADRVALGLSGVPAIPLAPFPAAPPVELASALLDHITGDSTQVVPLVWRTPDGRRIALNFGDAEATVDGVVVPPRSAASLSP